MHMWRNDIKIALYLLFLKMTFLVSTNIYTFIFFSPGRIDQRQNGGAGFDLHVRIVTLILKFFLNKALVFMSRKCQIAVNKQIIFKIHPGVCLFLENKLKAFHFMFCQDYVHYMPNAFTFLTFVRSHTNVGQKGLACSLSPNSPEKCCIRSYYNPVQASQVLPQQICYMLFMALALKWLAHAT